MVSSLNVRQDGYLKVSRTNKKILNKQIVLQHLDQDSDVQLSKPLILVGIFYHMDLKTAFLQGEAYDETRDIICEIPKECGYPPHIGARMKEISLWSQ